MTHTISLHQQVGREHRDVQRLQRQVVKRERDLRKEVPQSVLRPWARRERRKEVP